MGKIQVLNTRTVVRITADELISERFGVPSNQPFMVGSLIRFIAESKLEAKSVAYPKDHVTIEFDRRGAEYVVTFTE